MSIPSRREAREGRFGKRSVQIEGADAEKSWAGRITGEIRRGLSERCFKPKWGNDLVDSTSRSATLSKEATGRRFTVLVVDDEELVRYVTQELLACLGYDTTSASTGEEAVEKIRAGFRPDLVLMDVVMPGMGGIEAFRRLRQLAPGIKVLLSSGFTDPQAAAVLLNEGLNGIITKPYRMENLSARIREVLG